VSSGSSSSSRNRESRSAAGERVAHWRCRQTSMVRASGFRFFASWPTRPGWLKASCVKLTRRSCRHRRPRRRRRRRRRRQWRQWLLRRWWPRHRGGFQLEDKEGSRPLLPEAAGPITHARGSLRE
jgi:hypothetical protein